MIHPLLKPANHFLAVDGFINTGSFAITRFTLTRSLNLLDSVPNLPELGAQVLSKAITVFLFLWLILTIMEYMKATH